MNKEILKLKIEKD